MRRGSSVAVVLPALNEERSIGKVLRAIPNWVDVVVVVDNGSDDATARVARNYGARVVTEPRRGYGAACQAGIRSLDSPDVTVFLDADFSDHPEQMGRLVDPVIAGEADMVIGSRVLGLRARGALTIQQRVGNRLACGLMQLIWKARYTDLGPFRAIRHSTLKRLEMRDLDFGWTIEMQIKALLCGLRVSEVPMAYRRRIGESKISGTWRGAVGAGAKIIWVIVTTAVKARVLRRALVRGG